ncbi:UDP-glycosyltransferase 90A1-like [Olea europaea subsp. europaea]|uniref:UDP-glycosyltransferase 90A1-like n=1 Tax=Olea europaea subsp. europaea TaxID=158383 RepID=A0A8S0UYA6_OLEEU|nr:UDP-glycosyltransferase 90A1-like [Olea europaea subsp. europaea]CAA3023050.1 UDP-glycosyltransferase 90A1-like [Olea europaea subsp. europaea]
MASPHVVIFPFMSKGHTIPVLHLARLLLHRGAAVTLFTTPANRPFISTALFDTTVSIIDLPFPQNIDGIPPGVESTDKLPDMSQWSRLAIAAKLMKPYFEKALSSLPRISFMITDGFLGWTLESAQKFGIPRFVYYGMSNFSMALSFAVSQSRQLFIDMGSDNKKLFTIPSVPWIKFSRNDFDAVFVDPEYQNTEHSEYVSEQIQATGKSYGIIVNSFYELESVYADYWNREIGPKAWCVGPLCLSAPPPQNKAENGQTRSWIQWLDGKQEEGKPVLYVAFGSQADISREQIKQIKIGLEKSGVNFLWVVRNKQAEDDDGFEHQVRDRGLLVKEWVDQREILEHSSVQGFLSHCGWNSVMESICAHVPILAWPMMADQPLNAKMVVEEIEIGLRLETFDGSGNGFVSWEHLEKMVKELMEGEMGKKVRKKVKEIGGAGQKQLQKARPLGRH